MPNNMTNGSMFNIIKLIPAIASPSSKNKLYSGINEIHSIVKINMVGTIIDAEIRFRAFQVIFTDPKTKQPNFDWENERWEDDIVEYIDIEDLEVIKESIK